MPSLDQLLVRLSMCHMAQQVSQAPTAGSSEDGLAGQLSLAKQLNPFQLRQFTPA